jgi:hypothetical protein
MHAATSEPLRMPARPVGVLVFPWVLSSTFHTLALVLLALSWNSASRNAPPASGISLEATLLSSTTAGESAAAVRVDAPPAEGYFDDEQPMVVAQDNQSDTSLGGSAALQSLLDEQPAVSLSGVLPAKGGEEGTGGSDSGVAAASDLTGNPAPPNRRRGGYARTGVFGVEGEGNKFIYVFDRSGSMDGHGGAPMIAAKNELIASLDNLGQTHQFQIIFYNDEPRIFNPAGRSGRLVFGTDQNKNLARRFVGSITASGATRHLEALKMALSMGADVIFFLTDADEPRMTPQDLADIARMNHGTTINAIEFGSGSTHDADNFLVALARQNGGKHVYIDVTKLAARPK